MFKTALLSRILIFLCLSIYACNARHFRIVDDKSTSYNTKITGASAASKVKTVSEVKGTATDGNILRSHDEDPAAAPTQELKKESRIPTEELKYVQENKESSAGVFAPVKAPIANSVSWRVPEKSSSHGEHPGFDSDYSQPRTRTPCHN